MDNFFSGFVIGVGFTAIVYFLTKAAAQSQPPVRKEEIVEGVPVDEDKEEHLAEYWWNDFKKPVYDLED